MGGCVQHEVLWPGEECPWPVVAWPGEECPWPVVAWPGEECPWPVVAWPGEERLVAASWSDHSDAAGRSEGKSKCGKIVRRVAPSESGSGAVARAQGRALRLHVRVRDRVVKVAACWRSGSGPCTGCDVTGDVSHMTRWSKEWGRDQVV